MTEQTLEPLRRKASGLSEGPGVYLMKNGEGKIIYVGKAVNLKRRVSSYFHNIERHGEKTAALVSNIRDFDIMLAKNELEALLLENNLIKRYKPKYNILLKDDKGMSYLKITEKDDYPRLLLAHRRAEDGARYFGPYIASWSARGSLEAARAAFCLPRCQNPSPRPGARACMFHRIGRCMGVCVGAVTKEEYRAVMAQVASFLEGDIDGVVDKVREQMERAADNLDFERAARLRDCIRSLQTHKEGQRAVSGPRLNADYIGFSRGERQICVFVVSVRRGILAGSRSQLYPVMECAPGEEGELIAEFIKRLYSAYATDIPSKCCVPVPLPDSRSICEYLSYLKGGSLRIVTPKTGKDAELMRMAADNASEHLLLQEGRSGRNERAMQELASLMGLPSPPEWVEIYDISQTSGFGAVCGMAVCRRGSPVKSKYKRFKISEFRGGDDPDSLREAFSRRVERFRAGDEAFIPLPDCVIADGGQAQVNALCAVVAENGLSIPVFGLKKDSRHRTKSLVLPDGREVLLHKYPLAFRLAGAMQEEAHRFAVVYHRNVMTRRAYESELMSVKGVGKAKAAALMKRFKTMAALRRADRDALCEVPGITAELADRIRAFLDEKDGAAGETV